MDKKDFYSIPELAKLMGISRVAVFKKVKRGEIRARRVGKSYAVASSDINAGLLLGEDTTGGYGSIILYTPENKGPEIEARLQNGTIWMTQPQIAGLFGVKIPAISKHLRNIYKDGELNESSTLSKMEIVQKEGEREIKRSVDAYNLDAVLSVGYRVNSKRATNFRIWATGVLRNYMVDGYAINEKRVKEELRNLRSLKSAVKSLSEAVKLPGSKGMENELISLVSEFSASLDILQGYDDMTLKNGGVIKPSYALSYEDAVQVVEKTKAEYKKTKQASVLFGAGAPGKLKSLIGAVNQTFDGKELYPTAEEKAAHLLYFAVKDHPFTDGNKRLAAILFLHYMSKNGLLYLKNGEKRVSDGALAALTLLAAVSSPKEKETMINVITNAIQ